MVIIILNYSDTIRQLRDPPTYCLCYNKHLSLLLGHWKASLDIKVTSLLQQLNNNLPPLTRNVGNSFKTRRRRSRNNSTETRIILENYIYLCLHFPNRYKPVKVAHFCISK